ncbi:MAG: ABC transporter ATP-binding protein [Bacteroidota bacterium]
MKKYFRILSYGQPWYWMAGLAMFFALIYTIFSAASLVAINPFLQILFEEQAINPPQTELNWMDSDSFKEHMYYRLSTSVNTYGKQEILKWFCIALFGIILIKNAARYAVSYFISPFEQGILMNLRNKLYAHTSMLSLAFFTKRKKGDIISVLVSDVQVIQEAVIGTVQNFLKEPLTMIAFILVLFGISWKLTLFTLIILPVTGIFINYIRKSLKRKGRIGQELLGNLVSVLDEFLGGIRIVKSFQKESFERKKYEAQNQEYTDIQVQIRRESELASPISEVLSITVICVIILYSGSLILSQETDLKAKEFITFIAVFSQVMSPIKIISNGISKVQKGIAAFERIEELLATVPEIEEQAIGGKERVFTNDLRFEGVTFSYGEEDVLRDVSLEIPKGKMVALVGASGSGKSTILDLIPRFYDPQKGKITLDGTDIREWELFELRKLIGIVSQEGILFHDTVLSNIAYGIPNPDRNEVIEAAKIANAHEFIMQLPDQYDTIIGERGTRLSGGQRQRISIARAVLRNPPILILDEATSNLDTASEKLVQEALDKLMANRTSIVVAHRLSTIVEADEIFVVDAGKIVERGDHNSLLAINGVYKQLHSIQFGSQLIS